MQQFKDTTNSLGLLSEDNRKKIKSDKKLIDEFEDDHKFLTKQMEKARDQNLILKEALSKLNAEYDILY